MLMGPKGPRIPLHKRNAMSMNPVVAAPGAVGAMPMMKKGGKVKHKKHGGAVCMKTGGHVKYKKHGNHKHPSHTHKNPHDHIPGRKK